ncbi:glutathione S-transferase family protein [Bradyrhizobium japonicum]
MIMVESIAILEYLLARHGPSPLAVGPDDPAFAAYLQFLHLGEAGLAGPMNAVIVGRALAPEAERNARVTCWALETFHSRLGLVIQHLASRSFLAGDRFTAADISVSYALLLGLRTGNYARVQSSVPISPARRHAPPTPERWKSAKPPRLGRRDHRGCRAKS